MTNIDMEVVGKELIIKVDLSKRFGNSKSGKTIIIASTKGNQPVPGNEAIKVGVNVYTK